MTKRSATTKDVGLLYQLFQNGQLKLATEFQRNAVWPSPAKAYLIDTILNDKPIPLLFLQRTTSAQSGLPTYTVIDGQQRLRAIFEFLDDRFALTQSAKNSRYKNKKFSELGVEVQDLIRNYDLVIEEISGYSEADIKDMFVRINKYVVKLSPQELRHAKGEGRFHDFVEKIGKHAFWRSNKIFSPLSIKRMKAVEFSAELAILLIEGPQDKKASVDLYYGQYRRQFPEATAIESRLNSYFSWIGKALPRFSASRFRKPVDLYALIGALERATDQGRKLSKREPILAGQKLEAFEAKTRAKEPRGDAARYLAAARQQTDNLIPRSTRIEILLSVLRSQ